MQRPIRDIFWSYGVLDAQGKHVNGTDKETNHHYGDAYESLFPDEEDRADVKLVMEVGVADGSCLLAWRDIFPNALVVGMDIHHSDRAHGDRIEFRMGDQRSKADCERAAAGRLFDVILEDAYHSTENTLLTLFHLWPFVHPGGLYIVEEWADIHGCKENVKQLFGAEIVDTVGPSGGVEPLVVLRKPL